MLAFSERCQCVPRINFVTITDFGLILFAAHYLVRLGEGYQDANFESLTAPNCFECGAFYVSYISTKLT